MRRKVLQNVEHGINKSYRKGCRCFKCKEAHNAQCKKNMGKSSGPFKQSNIW